MLLSSAFSEEGKKGVTHCVEPLHNAWIAANIGMVFLGKPAKGIFDVLGAGC
jgi:hypothetical protein